MHFQRWHCQKPVGEKEKIYEKVIQNYTRFKCSTTVSIEIIYGYIGGQDMDYLCCDYDQSVECFEYEKKELIEEVNNSNLPVLEFYERNGPLTKCLVILHHQKKIKGNREHVLLHLIVQHKLPTIPMVGYTRRFDFTGKCSF